MVSISRAFHTIENQEMSLSEYQQYLKSHPHQESIKAIRCVECGDMLTYCHGECNVPYFKHTPKAEGHGYCSLYHKGIISNTDEALMRKKIFKEEGITFNFELLYKNGKWKSIITIPPLKSDEINQNESNQTVISIIGNYKIQKIPISIGNFTAGEIKAIQIHGFPEKIDIRISGNSTNNDITYLMDGFNPNNQIYSYLISQDDLSKHNDFKSIKSFACKRNNGHIYIGKHYIIFSSNPNLHLKEDFKNDDINIKNLNIINDLSFNYYAYDIVFNKISDYTIEFCNKRNCELLEREDAVILWPPIRSIGNYHFYNDLNSTMFISFENENRSLILNQYDCKRRLFFKIQNINSTSFYITYDKRKRILKESISLKEIELNEISNYPNLSKYCFKNNVLISKLHDTDKIKKNHKVVLFNNQLDRVLAFDRYTLCDEILVAIRYSRKYINFDNRFYDFLLKKYFENNTIIEYLNHCKSVGTIKEKAFELLIEGERNI